MKESYQRIYVVWQDPKSRKHFPVGELKYVHNDHEVYHFNYIHGVIEAKKNGFQAFPGFPELDMTYVSAELFPFFQNRILLSAREEYEDFIKSLGLSPSEAKPIDILARSGGRRATDTVEMFSPAHIIDTNEPDIKIAKYYFLLHGLSYMRDCAQVLVSNMIKAGDSLFIMHDLHNPVDPKALVLRTVDYCSIGFVPRYLLDDLWYLIDKQTDIKFYICKVNKPPLPLQLKIVCSMEAKVQNDFISCISEDYKPYKDVVKV